MNTVTLDFVSDIACPWCAIGLASLEQALQRLGPDLQVEIRFQPFELNPQMPAQGQDVVEHLSQKYGIDAAQIEQNRQLIRERGAALGFQFGTRSRIWNTFDAHRLLHEAGEQDPALQHRLKKRLLQAYHGEGGNPGDPALLLLLAVEAGMDAARAQAVITSDLHAEAVREAEAFWQSAGIRAVPAVVINRQHLISGGQPPEVFEQALRQIAASAQAGA